MRDVPGRQVSVNSRAVYVEESGQGQAWVVFEAGNGCGRTCWDPVLPLLSDTARLVAYDRAGRPTCPSPQPLSIDDMAADLVSMTDAVVPRKFVLVAHSMGGLVARRALDRLEPRLLGMVLVDALPETSPVYDTWDQTATNIDRVLAVTQPLTAFRPLAGLFSRNIRRLYSADTYQTMLAEDFTPAGVSQTRREVHAVAAAIRPFRAQPPQIPKCPTIVLSAGRAAKGRERQHASLVEHQRRYADTLPNGHYEKVDAAHFIHAEQPQLLAAHIRQLLQVPV